MNKALHVTIAAIILCSAYSSAQAEDAAAPTAAEQQKKFVPSAERGKDFFNRICSHCHNITYEESHIGAPGLRGVLDRHDEAWLNQWLKSPETFAKTDETARDLIAGNKFGLAMPTIPAMQDDRNRADIIAYLKTLK